MRARASRAAFHRLRHHRAVSPKRSLRLGGHRRLCIHERSGLVVALEHAVAAGHVRYRWSLHFSFDALAPGILYGPAYANSRIGVQKSMDGGATWTQLNTPFSGCCVVPDRRSQGACMRLLRPTPRHHWRRRSPVLEERRWRRHLDVLPVSRRPRRPSDRGSGEPANYASRGVSQHDSGQHGVPPTLLARFGRYSRPPPAPWFTRPLR